jgi:hypothetical protein
MSKEQKILAYGLETRTWWFNDKYGYGCAECCNGDRCDEDCTAKYKGRRKDCPHCKGKGFIPESEAILLQNVQGSDTIGDDGSGEDGNKIKNQLEGLNDLDGLTASNQTPVNECYEIISIADGMPTVEDDYFVIGNEDKIAVLYHSGTKQSESRWFANVKCWLKKVTLPVTDWEKLEEKFFKECVDYDEIWKAGRPTQEQMAKMKDPEQVWNWIKSNIK